MISQWRSTKAMESPWSTTWEPTKANFNLVSQKTPILDFWTIFLVNWSFNLLNKSSHKERDQKDIFKPCGFEHFTFVVYTQMKGCFQMAPFSLLNVMIVHMFFTSQSQHMFLLWMNHKFIIFSKKEASFEWTTN